MEMRAVDQKCIAPLSQEPKFVQEMSRNMQEFCNKFCYMEN